MADFVAVAVLEDKHDIAEYISKNFSLHQKVCDHHLTGQEAIDSMRQGTPYGIILYYTLHGHKDCCLKID